MKKMEDSVHQGLADREKFILLLEDEIFVDYFNTFLSLPVFGKRLFYRRDLRLFEVDPGPVFIDQYYVQADILTWILAERGPMFYKTDISNEFRLCKYFYDYLRNHDLQDIYELDFLKEIGNVMAMQRFKAFLHDSVGERNLMFWLAAERFRRQTLQEDRRFVLREIQDKFIRQGAWLELSGGIKSAFMSSLETWSGMQNGLRTSEGITSVMLLEPQKKAFATLIDYWLPKYLAHRVHRRNILRNKWKKVTNTSEDLVQVPPEEDGKNFVLFSVYQDLKDSKDPSKKYNEKVYETELDTLFDESSSTQDDNEKRCLQLSESIPDDIEFCKSENSNETVITIDDNNDIDDYYDNIVTSENHEVTSKLLHLPCSTIPTSTDQDLQSEDHTQDIMDNEASVCDMNITTEQHLQVVYNELREASLSKAVTLTQIVRGASLVDMEPNLAFPAGSFEDDILSANQDENGLEHVSAALSSDSFAGQPFCNYIKLLNNEQAFADIRFWTAAQHYLSNLTQMDTLTRHRQASALIQIYLRQDSPRNTSLSLDIKGKLCDQLPKDIGLATLALACVYCAQALLPCWRNFVQIEEGRFDANVNCRFSSSTLYNNGKIAPEKSTRHCRRRQKRENIPPKRIWNALQLAIAISVPRRAKPLLEGYEDVDEDSRKGDYQGSLHCRQLRILNQQAIKALEDYRNRNPHQCAMAYHFYQQNFLLGTIASKPAENDRTATITKQSPTKHHRDMKSRLGRPRTFQEILHDPMQLDSFKKFLLKHEADCPLLFWQAVESMRTNTREAKQRQSRANGILRRFFGASTNQGKDLNCNADIVKELPYMSRVTPAMLVSAQTCVARSMEEKWFIQYLTTFPEEDELPGITKLPHYRTFQTMGSDPNRGMRQKIRGLWKIFARNVISFKRGIANQRTRKHFENFLRNENELNVKRSKEQGEDGAQRVLISSKLVYTDKLIHDLRFWTEVDRYKDFADAVVLCARLGNYTKDDELIVIKKAKAILNCFLDSQIPPKIQVNVSVDIADSVMNLVKNDIIERGLFHESALSVFSVLLHYWKKFCYFRILPKARLPKSSESIHSDRSNQIAVKREAIRRNVIRRVSIQPDDELTKLMFSLQNGLRLVVVPVEEEVPDGILKLPKINTLKTSKATRG